MELESLGGTEALSVVLQKLLELTRPSKSTVMWQLRSSASSSETETSSSETETTPSETETDTETQYFSC